MPRFSILDRPSQVAQLKDSVFDLVIIGGGITGAGVARDAASRGMRVALVEAQDFAQGTSSRSSKLIHGGIRYLENMEFGLVFEALSERRLLFEIAPHLVHPLRFVLPLYEGGRVGMFKMGLGMWLYDALSMFEAPELHERLNHSESIERLPLLRQSGLMGSYVYSDAYMDDDRLTLETLRSAYDLGAVCVNHIAATGAEFQNGKVSAITCTDHLGQSQFSIRGQHFVSTVGPWTDIFAQNILHSWKKILRPSKGVHLTFSRERLGLTQAVVMAADNDKRIVFGIPRHEMCIVGTTDTDYPGDPAKVSVEESDVDYILGVASHYFPGAKLTSSDIISSYAGVRPLVDDGAASESKTSREHLILSDPRNVTFVAGGKYTTYRRMAEHTVETALLNFSLEDQIRFRHGSTKQALNPLATPLLLENAIRNIPYFAKETGLNPSDLEFLVGRHAGEAEVILNSERKEPRILNSEQRIFCMEAQHALQHTMCAHLTDWYVRRVPLFLAHRDHGLRFLELISHVFAKELNWSDSVRLREVNEVQSLIQHELKWKLSMGLEP